MASCLMVARCVGVRGYTKKDNTPAFTLTVATDSGDSVQLFGSGSCPNYPFGTELSIGFDLSIFNGKVNGLRLESVKEYKS